MAKTKAELRDRALRKLGKLALGQTAEADLATDMEDAYDQVYAKLAQRGVVSWSSTDSVPNEYVEDITALMAFERSEAIPGERYARVREDASRALINISALVSGAYVNPRDYADF